jgi:hypothetical protein
MVVKISEKRHGLGSEHPLCDKIQLIIIILCGERIYGEKSG